MFRLRKQILQNLRCKKLPTEGEPLYLLKTPKHQQQQHHHQTRRLAHNDDRKNDEETRPKNAPIYSIRFILIKICFLLYLARWVLLKEAVDGSVHVALRRNQSCKKTKHLLIAKSLSNYKVVGWEPCLVVMGKDSRFKGRGFESRHHILDGHFFTYICCKNCNVCLKRPKINKKEAGVGPFYKKTTRQLNRLNVCK